ncbi:hypothetical protein SAMN05444007_108242 [Cribrihabitans marinus]|uniref:N-acetyltransferase domain-containing protein n=1 Tax=Cribrihabitans marinus TaxID=1227549 RepID=A0A1H7D008_9RHOB|nr:hypothetical protein [Cribrihabitans marinus]GGH36258.1 hypothetical protein GCM10010973_30120 [Cribrihabitans marinus]SEJ91445.1 hypothetical protein SAMN05444007_108242 [Cribrihabitans marinus]
MILAQPYDDHVAMAVLSCLDGDDLVEAQLVRGGYASHLALFADWRSLQPHCVLSLVLRDQRLAGQPFAVLAVSNTGQAGVAQAALLARPHRRHARALVATCRRIRTEMPGWCADLGIHRVEARAHAGHPRASRFLSACGFVHEADMPGFGADGRATFRQFAWTDPTLKTGD